MRNVDQLVGDVLKQHPHIALGILFGSQATGQTTPSSDLDLAVASERLLTAAESRGLIEDIALRFGGPVDIIDLNAVAGLILHQALCKGRVLLNRRPDIYARLMLKMWYNQADFMPSYRMMLRKRVEAFAHG
ncbi:MAG: nucleotidyltransferase domain-containing protein [Lentisphaerae bacterium]|nr:nucleotidyltransferase domain-containing protein [Lentisphaerota bacterium]